MSQAHLEGMLRFCGAITQVTGQQSYFINNLLSAVEGDKDSHGGMGDLISAIGGSFFINGKKMIVTGDKGAPDSVGTIMHPFSPTGPAQGSMNFFAFDGKAGGGLAQMLSGVLNLDENLLLNGLPIGEIKNMLGGLQGGTGGAGSQGTLVLQNMGNYTPQPGDILTGAETGATIQILSFVRSSTFDRTDTLPDYTDVMANALTDDFGVIAMPQHFTGYESQDYQSGYIVIT